MTGKEFTEHLQKSGEVNFEESTLTLPDGGMAAAFIGPLSAARWIHYGLQTSRLHTDRVTYSGEHQWWLILDERLIHVTAKMIKLGPPDYELQAVHRAYRRAVVSTEVRSHFGGAGSEFHLRKAHLQLKVDEKTLLDVSAELPASSVGPRPRALVLFGQHLVA